MKKEENGMKVCKHCKSEIAADAKICPNCRKKQGANGCLVVIVVVLLLAIFGIALSGGSDSDTATDTGTVVEENGKTEIEYISYSVDDMMADLEQNAMSASDKYKNQYVEISGRLAAIDSDGKYISVLPAYDDWAFVGVSCYIKSDEQKETVKTLSIGDTVTVCGKITTVGDVLGYGLDIDSIR